MAPPVILLLGRCGLERLAAALRARGFEAHTGPWTGVELAERLRPELVYVDLFDWDRMAPLTSAAVAGLPVQLDEAELAGMRAVASALRAWPVVYRGLRRPMAGAFGLLERAPPDLALALDALEAVVAGERVLDVGGLWARAGLVSDELAHGLGHGEALYRPGGPDPAEVEAGWLAALWRARIRGPVKVLVVDLDDTLFHGELADDDFALRNPAYLPEGEAPRAGALEGWWRLKRGLHEALRIVARRGVLLTVATRNDPELVRRRWRKRSGDPGDPGTYAWMYEDLPPERREATFARHPVVLDRLALGPEDVQHVEAGFGPKSAMCRAIAETLGVGLDSLALLDDSPYERAEVRENAPQVTVLDGPVDGFREQLVCGPLFTVWERTEAALKRVESYRSRAAVVRAEADPDGLERFLRSLQIRARVRPAVPGDLPRVRELLRRTHQLNLTGFVPELSDTTGVYVAELRDRVADHGLVSAGVFRDGRLLAWVCSCRVLPHRVAGSILWAMRAAEPDAAAERVPTERNGATTGLLEEAARGPVPWVDIKQE